MKTYILPASAWSILLGPIVKDAPPGSVIECHTRVMYVMACLAVDESGRGDLVVRLNEKNKEAA